MPNQDYKITSIAVLRKVLRKFGSFDCNEIDSALMLLDLRDALGDNPMVAPAITPRQRQVIQAHLIEDREAGDAAKHLGIVREALVITERSALTAILAYLQGEPSAYRSKQWRPWMTALLKDETLSLSQLSQRIGKTELAIKIKMTKLRKHNEPIPFRRRASR